MSPVWPALQGRAMLPLIHHAGAQHCAQHASSDVFSSSTFGDRGSHMSPHATLGQTHSSSHKKWHPDFHTTSQGLWVGAYPSGAGQHHEEPT